MWRTKYPKTSSIWFGSQQANTFYKYATSVCRITSSKKLAGKTFRRKNPDFQSTSCLRKERFTKANLSVVDLNVTNQL